MIYDKILPPIKDLKKLAELVSSFPVSCEEMRQLARDKGFSSQVVDFIDTFPENSNFDSIDDFLMRVENLEILIDEERISPYEIPQTPQG